MESVFVAGSIAIKQLPSNFVAKLESLLASKLGVFVGDANGVDTSVQRTLLERNATSVMVYCTGSAPRNNLGDWPIKQIKSRAQPGTKAYFTAKDVAMAEDADIGLMLWDTKSTGTLSNVIELAQRRKKSIVFINKRDLFWIVRDTASLRELTGFMSAASRDAAEKKVGLSSRLDKLESELSGFNF